MIINFRNVYLAVAMFNMHTIPTKFNFCYKSVRKVRVASKIIHAEWKSWPIRQVDDWIIWSSSLAFLWSVFNQANEHVVRNMHDELQFIELVTLLAEEMGTTPSLQSMCFLSFYFLVQPNFIGKVKFLLKFQLHLLTWR